MAEVITEPLPESAETVADRVFPAPQPLKIHKKMGRPPDPDKANIPHLPKPPGFKPNPTKFCQYWTNTDKQFPDRLTVYVYRTYPIIDRERLGKLKNIDVIPAPFPFETGQDIEDEVLHRWGSGKYLLILNDSALKKSVCQTRIEVENSDHPPLVSMDELLLNHPSNRDFVESLKRRGVQFPGEPMKGEDVGNEALSAMVQSNRDLTERVIEMASDREPAQAAENMDAKAANMGMQIIKSASDMGGSIVDNATKKATEIMSQITQGQANPIETVKNFVAIAQAMNPQKEEKPDPMVAALVEESKALRGQLFQMMNNRTESLEKELAAVRGNVLLQQAQPAVPAQPAFQPRMIDDLDKLLNVVDKLKASFGGGEELEKTPRGSDNIWATILPMAIPMVTGIFGMISNIVYNYAAARTGQQPTLPPPPPPQAYTPEQMAEIASGRQPEQFEAQPQEAAQMPNIYMRILSNLEKPLKRALENCEAGDEQHAGASFAYLVIEWEDRMTYDALRELGKDTIIQLLAKYQPIWQYVSRIPQKFNVFLDGFLAADEIMKADQEKEDQELAGASQLVSLPPVTVKRKIKTVEATSEPGKSEPTPAA